MNRFILIASVILNIVFAQNSTLTPADLLQKQKEDKIRQEGFLAGLQQSQANIAKDIQTKKETASILNSQIPVTNGDAIKTHDPLVPLGSSMPVMATPVAQMRSADDDVLAAFTSFLSPKIFNQNQVKAAQPTPPPAQPQVIQQQVAPQTGIQQQGFPQQGFSQMTMPQQQQFGGAYQDPSVAVNNQGMMPNQGYNQVAPYGAQQPYQALDPRMMGVPNAGIPMQNGFGAQPQMGMGNMGGWPQQQF